MDPRTLPSTARPEEGSPPHFNRTRDNLFLVDLGQLAQSGELGRSTLAVGEHVTRQESSMGASHMSRQRTLVDQPHDVRARESEQVGRLLRGQFRIGGDDVDGDSGRQVAQQRSHCTVRILGKNDRLVAYPNAHRRLVRVERRDGDSVAFLQIEHLGFGRTYAPSTNHKRHNRNCAFTRLRNRPSRKPGERRLSSGGAAHMAGYKRVVAGRWPAIIRWVANAIDPAASDTDRRDIRTRTSDPLDGARCVRRPLWGGSAHRRYTARHSSRSSVACVFDAEAAEIQRSLTGNRQAWSSAECELMPH